MSKKQETKLARIEESIRLARLHFERKQNLKVIQASENPKSLSYRSISHLLNQGRDSNWWSLQVISDMGAQIETSRNKKLENKFDESCFVKKVVVVECKDVSEAQSPQYKSADKREQEKAALASDLLHLQLSIEAAKYLVPKFRDQDSIGIGSGRAAVYAAYFSSKSPDVLKLEDPRIFSLSGGVRDVRWSTGHDVRLSNLPYSVDADIGVTILADASKIEKKNQHLAYLPVSLPDPIAAMQAVAPHLISQDTHLNIAILGLGALSSRHHYYAHPGPELAEIKEEIEKIKQIQNKDPDRVFDGIGEICHYLFWCGEDENACEIKEILQRINSKIIAIRKETLKNTRETFLIAGGAQKLAILEKILTREYPDIPVTPRYTTLITDNWTALQLIDSIRKLGKPRKPSRKTKS
jgi:DNA-binding transcriptional regulator LsrR (DeoR family)